MRQIQLISQLYMLLEYMKLFSIIIMIGAVLAGCASSSDVSSNGIGSVEMFYVGGQVETVGDVVQHVNHALVHSLIPKKITKDPIIMYPGLGLSAHTFLSTPDRRPGWAQYFVKSGHPVYVFDPVNTGPSGIKAGQHNLKTWDASKIWPRFGFGEAKDVPYPNTRFPIEQIDQFYASWSTRPQMQRQGSGKSRRTINPSDKSDPNQGALIDLLGETGPAILMAHSWASRATTGAIRARPDLVKGAIFLETVTCPDASNIEAFEQQPFLTVYGDFIDSRGQTGRFEECEAAVSTLKERGAKAKMISLTEIGVRGNSHIFMQEDNNIDIAAMIASWIDQTIK